MTSEADILGNGIDPGDILLAARSTCAVLITAMPDHALQIAQAIARERGCADRLLVHDFAKAEDLSPAPRSALILLLREIHDLTRRQQALLMELLEARQGATPRIIASSSVSLYDRVKEGSFDARLYYRLNAVHVVAARPGRTGRPEDVNAVM